MLAKHAIGPLRLSKGRMPLNAISKGVYYHGKELI